MTRYGIRITLPDDDPMRAAHLLGDEWETVRWYDTEAARDRALREMQRQPGYYRRGDSPTQILTKTEEGV